MDRDRFSFLAHASLDYANPVSLHALDRACELAGVRRAHRVLDVGCGKASLLIRLAERYGAIGTGIERSRLMHTVAATRAAERAPDLVAIHLADATEFVRTLQPASFELSLCIGSSHALGGREASLDTLKRLTKPGGQILLGEGYWERPPAPEYLTGFGGSESELTTHAANVALGESRGLIPIWSTTASERDWDEYEWSYSRAIEDFARERPDDPDTPAMLERSRNWRRLYLQHGRDTMGFGLYLLRAPA
jgi:SAM-dependent methyltransferase